MLAEASDIQQIAKAHLLWQANEQPPSLWEGAQTITLPHDWSKSRPDYSGSVWYRLHFSAPTAQLPAVYLPRVCTNAQVWVNGTLVGSGGAMQEPIARNCYAPQLHSLPSGLLRPEGNVLDIRLVGYAANEVAARQRFAGLSAVMVGAEAALREQHDEQYFWNITIAQIIGGALLVFGLIVLMLAWVRPSDQYFLYFGLTLIGWAVIGIRLYWRDVPINGPVSEVLITSLFPPVVGFGVLFLLSFVRRQLRWLIPALVAQAIAVPLLMLASGTASTFRIGSTVFTLIAIEFVVALIWSGMVAWKHMRTDFWIMGIALLIAAGMVVAEIAIQNTWLPLPRVHLIHFGLPLVFFAISVRLVQQFATMLTRSEHITQELEERVAQKALEIENNYEQISYLRSAQAAQQERQRIAADLHDDLGAKLLTIAQTAQNTYSPSSGNNTAHLARQALDDMRLSVRGLTAQPALAQLALADWRGEIVQRLQTAQLQVEWVANEPPEDLLLGARLQVQFTRILREATSNLIRHGKASKGRIDIQITDSELWLDIHDDGCGLPQALLEKQASAKGHGLINIERRARNLGGSHSFGRSPLGGALISVRAPLRSNSQPMPLQ